MGLDLLSISALDLFASALGAFMLLSIILFPFYLKQPTRIAEEAQATAERSAAIARLNETEARLAAATAAAAKAESAVKAAEQRRARALTDVAAAREQAAAAAEAAKAVAVTPPQVAPPPVPVRRRHGSLKIADLDVVFVMDATGSMRDEIADVRANLIGIVRILHRMATALRVGFVAYKDRGDDFVTRSFALSPMTDANAQAIAAFVGSITTGGGGDVPEPIDQALQAAIAMPWSAGADGQIIVVGDAPVHAENRAATLAMADAFRRSAGNRTVSAIFTGSDEAGRVFFSQLARAGGGDFSMHQGQMLESVLLSVLRNAGPTR
jgi:multidrug efflux pump subunit AcrA (membrane-fusion protein)